MRLGVITTNFPPARGGMQEHARGLVTCLARNHEVQAFVRPGLGLPLPNLTVTDSMTWSLAQDLPVLRRAAVDAWLLLDAGLANYARHLAQPSFVYVHGNDFIRPWYPRPSLGLRARVWLMRRLRRPGIEDAITAWRRQKVGAGLHAARAVFANSRFSRDRCREMYGLPPDRMHVVPPGIDADFFRAMPRPPSPDLRLVTVARLAKHAARKNVEGVLAALALLQDEIAFRYDVVGDGDDRARLEQLAHTLGIAPRVRFLGEVAHPDLVALYAASDVFIMPVKPSPTDFEGFGMVYAEAAAAGLPSIATAAGGIPDVVQPGVSGLLLETGAPAEIAAAIRHFHHDRGRFDPARLRRFARQFSAEACTAQLLETVVRSLNA